MEVLLSEDEMTCCGFFYPPTENGNPIEPESVGRILQESGVSHGVDWNNIQAGGGLV